MRKLFIAGSVQAAGLVAVAWGAHRLAGKPGVAIVFGALAYRTAEVSLQDDQAKRPILLPMQEMPMVEEGQARIA